MSTAPQARSNQVRKTFFLVLSCFFILISLIFFQSKENLTKNQKKKLRQKAKKQQKLLQIQIEQIEASEREGKPLIDVNVKMLIDWNQQVNALIKGISTGARGLGSIPYRSNRIQCRQRPATVAEFHQSCGALAPSHGDGAALVTHLGVIPPV